jgi:hypothetical protein
MCGKEREVPKITSAGASNAGEAPVTAAEFTRPEQGFVMTGQWEPETPAAAEVPEPELAAAPEAVVPVDVPAAKSAPKTAKKAAAAAAQAPATPTVEGSKTEAD